MMFYFAIEEEHASLVSLMMDPKSNFINWLLLAAILIWACAKFLPPVFKNRSQQIDQQINSAREARLAAAKALADQKKRITAADTEIEQIVAEAKHAAAALQKQMEEQTQKDIEELKKKLAASIVTERQLAVNEMRAIAIKVAVKVAEESIAGGMTEASKKKLLTQFVEQLDHLDKDSYKAENN